MDQLFFLSSIGCGRGMIALGVETVARHCEPKCTHNYPTDQNGRVMISFGDSERKVYSINGEKKER